MTKKKKNLKEKIVKAIEEGIKGRERDYRGDYIKIIG